jgi:hypothetical protein
LNYRIGGGKIKRLHIGTFIVAIALAICIIPAAVGSINGQSTLTVQEKINSNDNNVLNQNVEVKAAYKKKTTKKTYAKKTYKKSYKKVSYKKSYKKVKAAYTYKRTYSYSSIGDCWAMSEYLYNKYASQVRIVQYRTSMSSRHRSIQINQNGAWVDFNYRGNGYNGIYSATSSKPGLTVVKSK